MKVITKRAQVKITMLLLSFNNFTIQYLIKKILRYKMRGIKSKNQNFGTYETNK